MENEDCASLPYISPQTPTSSTYMQDNAAWKSSSSANISHKSNYPNNRLMFTDIQPSNQHIINVSGVDEGITNIENEKCIHTFEYDLA